MTAARDPLEPQSSADWSGNERVLDDFEAAWQAGKRPKIEDYISEPAPGNLVAELVHIELEFRLKAGEEARVEDYLIAPAHTDLSAARDRPRGERRIPIGGHPSRQTRASRIAPQRRK